MNKPQKSYTGKGGDFNTALKGAVRAAERAIPWPDGVVTWVLKSVSGSTGGFASRNEVVVEITATFT